MEVALGTFAAPATSPEFVVEGRGWRNTWRTGTGTATSYVGKQNLHLSLPSGAVGNRSIPQGSGYATLSITATGITSIAGRAADGTVISTAGLLGPSGQVLLFHSPYGVGQGNINGVLTVSGGGLQPVTGSARWAKLPLAPASTDRNYKGGFGPVTLTVEGAKYEAPTGGNLVVNLPIATAPTNNASITFSPLRLNAGQTALEGSVNALCNVASNHVVTPSSTVNLVAMTITPTTGNYVGTVRVVDGTVTREAKFYGLFVPSSTVAGVGKGYGWFLIPQLPSTPDTPPAANAPWLSGRVVIDKHP
jgi:hypothetical protein